jgi:hypothetical protein
MAQGTEIGPEGYLPIGAVYPNRPVAPLISYTTEHDVPSKSVDARNVLTSV